MHKRFSNLLILVLLLDITYFVIVRNTSYNNADFYYCVRVVRKDIGDIISAW